MTERWLAALAHELGTDPVDQDPLLDVARVVAHSVERRAAPLTTFLIGVAAGKTGVDVDSLCARVKDMAAGWEPEGSDR